MTFEPLEKIEYKIPVKTNSGEIKEQNMSGYQLGNSPIAAQKKDTLEWLAVHIPTGRIIGDTIYKTRKEIIADSKNIMKTINSKKEIPKDWIINEKTLDI